MSLIEQARSLVREIVPTQGAATDDEPDPVVDAPTIDIAHDTIDDDQLERTRREWAAPPQHR